VDISCLAFSKSFDTVSRKILIEKLLKYGLDEQTVRYLPRMIAEMTDLLLKLLVYPSPPHSL